MFDVTERVRTGLYLLHSEQSYVTSTALPSLRIHHNILLALQMNQGYNETAFVMQVLLQPGLPNLRN
jgi:hypothetical protein